MAKMARRAGLMLCAMYYSLDWIATVPPTVRLCGEVFRRENTSIVFDWMVATHQIGAAFAAYMAASLRTISVSYVPAFMCTGALSLVAAVGVLRLDRGGVGYPSPQPDLFGTFKASHGWSASAPVLPGGFFFS